METRDQRIARKNQATADYWRRHHEYMNGQIRPQQQSRYIVQDPLPPAPDDDEDDILDFDQWGQGKDE